MNQPAGTGPKIVVMDDDDALLNMLQLALTAGGYQVRVANNGKQGLKLVEEEQPDLVLTDLVMPEQEGLESIMQLRKAYPAVRIIAMSGGIQYGTVDLLPVALSLGAQRVLQKPVGKAVLLQTVKEVLEAR